MNGFQRSACLVCGLLGVSAAARADTVTVYPAKDNTLYESASGDTSNGAGPVIFAGENSQGKLRRAVLRFDPAAALPEGAVVTGVELVLTVTSAPNTNAVTMTLHRLSRDWGEGSSNASSGRGAPATTGDATWIYAFYPDVAWTQVGGDFGAARASASVASEGTASWSGDNLVDDVKAWIADPQQNFGWLLKGEESTPATARQFASREAVTESQRPQLVIEYAPAVKVRFSSWGEQKTHWGNNNR